MAVTNPKINGPFARWAYTPRVYSDQDASFSNCQSYWQFSKHASRLWQGSSSRMLDFPQLVTLLLSVAAANWRDYITEQEEKFCYIGACFTTFPSEIYWLACRNLKPTMLLYSAMAGQESGLNISFGDTQELRVISDKAFRLYHVLETNVQIIEGIFRMFFRSDRQQFQKSWTA